MLGSWWNAWLGRGHILVPSLGSSFTSSSSWSSFFSPPPLLLDSLLSSLLLCSSSSSFFLLLFFLLFIFFLPHVTFSFSSSFFLFFPIRRRLLDLILFEVQRIFPGQPYLEKLYLGMFSISYYGMFRIGEIAKSPHTMKAKDMHIASNKNKILILLHSSKTHGKGSYPQKIKIQASQPRSNSFFCPFKLLRAYLEARGDYINETEDFFIFKDRATVQAENVRTILRKALKNLGLRADLYNTHSFRIGKATEMMAANYTIAEIMRAGRWRTTSSVLRYFRP